MVTTPLKNEISKAIKAVGEQRVVFHGLSWDDYLQIFQALPQRRNSRLTFDRGILEITMPLEDHEFSLRLIEVLIRIMAEVNLLNRDFVLTTLRQRLDRIKQMGVKDLALFGSVASDEADAESDLDFLVEFEAELTFDLYSGLRN